VTPGPGGAGARPRSPARAREEAGPAVGGDAEASAAAGPTRARSTVRGVAAARRVAGAAGAALLLLVLGLGLPTAGADEPLSPAEAASLREIRDFVAAAARAYRMAAPLEISVAPWIGSPALPQYAATPAVYTGGALYLNRRLLGHPSRDLVVAKSLAYEMLRAPSAATSLADRERERRLRELDADALVVDILVRVKGWPESQALEATYGWLLAMHRVAAASGQPPRPGGVTPCEEIAALLRRFPAHRDAFAARECAPR
jgi:hypothetical protein